MAATQGKTLYCCGTIKEAFTTILRYNFVSINLASTDCSQSLKQQLFSKHLGYKEAAMVIDTHLSDLKIPLQSLLISPNDLQHHDLLVKNLLSPWCVYFKDMSQLVPDNESGDKIILETMLHTIHGIGSTVFNECHLESRTRNNLVGGNIDVIMGNLNDGDKPWLAMHNAKEGPITLYSTTMVEAKSRPISLTPAKRSKFDYLKELQRFGQPIRDPHVVGIMHFPQ